ncbi:MAG: chemotaxis protein CheW [Ruminococcus sp.]|jgi:purine-binding chemotaxis protein CheW|nr:chemotaxis protein CheW [Ruminococcus sp.]
MAVNEMKTEKNDRTAGKKGTTSNGTEILWFNVGEVVYGIEIKYINEIIGIDNTTVIPKIPEYIKGVINIRGKVVPVISIRRRFGIEEIPYDDRTCIIVLEFDNGMQQVGVIVDRVREVDVVSSSLITQTPNYQNVNQNRYIKNIIENRQEGEEVKLLLDCEKLIWEGIA